ncbi:rhodanese-like domain-containing protein [Loigolactobacillus binensis]|uniref:Rhodanese-like domain-containing protein n=1 Tax=Loigolactobacillus binensis TaxID=2559922 RepID=A0ABW3ED32_9LACO|nr:rhodanese-like domain-containing protein [Loigolactobacillus binensis]
MVAFNMPKNMISATDLMAKLPTGVTLLDVRTPEEYRAGHIRQAQNFPLDSITEYAGTDKEVYAICHSGQRSAQACQILRDKGYNAISVRGGMNLWQGPVVTSD